MAISTASTTSASSMNPKPARSALTAPPSQFFQAHDLQSKACPTASARPRTPIYAPTTFTLSQDNDVEMFQSTPYHLAQLGSSGLSSAFPNLSTTPTCTPPASDRRIDRMHTYIAHKRSINFAFRAAIQYYNHVRLHHLLSGPYLADIDVNREYVNRGDRPIPNVPTALIFLAGAEPRHHDVALVMSSDLLTAGAEVEYRSKEGGRTALHVAARMDNAAMCGLLLLAGAERETRDGEGRTALEVAVMNGCGEAAKELRACVG